MSGIFIASLEVFALFAVAFTVLARLGSKGGFLKPMLLLWVLTISLSAISHPLSTWGAKALFYFFAFSFFGLYALVLVAARNSVTLRMMDEIETAGPLNISQLRARFSDTESVDARIEMMQRNGVLERRKDGSIKLLPKGEKIGKAALLLRRIFSITTPG